MPAIIEGVTFYTVPEAAKHIGKSDSTIKAAIKSGQLKAVEVNTRLHLIREADLTAFKAIVRPVGRPIGSTKKASDKS